MKSFEAIKHKIDYYKQQVAYAEQNIIAFQDNEILDAIMENDKDTYIGMPTDKNWI